MSHLDGGSPNCGRLAARAIADQGSDFLDIIYGVEVLTQHGAAGRFSVRHR